MNNFPGKCKDCTIRHEIRNPINQSEFNGRSLLGIGPLYCPISHEIRIPICQSGFNGSCRVEIPHLTVIKTSGCLEQIVFGLGDEKLPSVMGIFISRI